MSPFALAEENQKKKKSIYSFIITFYDRIFTRAVYSLLSHRGYFGNYGPLSFLLVLANNIYSKIYLILYEN